MSPTTKPPVVLVVEDEALVRMDISDFLTDAGYRVIAEVTPEHALAVLNVRSDIAVLVTDINMPGSLNGCALARIVELRWPGIGIIATSGKGRSAPGELPGRALFLLKPYTPSALLEAVRAAGKIDGGGRTLLGKPGTSQEPAARGPRVDDLGNGTARVQIDEVVPWSVAVKLLDLLREAAGSDDPLSSNQVTDHPGRDRAREH